jgi:hypothetical protein
VIVSGARKEADNRTEIGIDIALAHRRGSEVPRRLLPRDNAGRCVVVTVRLLTLVRATKIGE